MENVIKKDGIIGLLKGEVSLKNEEVIISDNIVKSDISKLSEYKDIAEETRKIKEPISTIPPKTIRGYTQAEQEIWNIQPEEPYKLIKVLIS